MAASRHEWSHSPIQQLQTTNRTPPAHPNPCKRPGNNKTLATPKSCIPLRIHLASLEGTAVCETLRQYTHGTSWGHHTSTLTQRQHQLQQSGRALHPALCSCCTANGNHCRLHCPYATQDASASNPRAWPLGVHEKLLWAREYDHRATSQLITMTCNTHPTHAA